MRKKDILEKYPAVRENVLLILHELQDTNPQNYLQEEDLALVANYLNTTLSSIYGIVSYYSMFSLKPRGRHIVRICQSPVCDMHGCANLLGKLQRILKIDLGETSQGGLFTLESTECVGRCDQAPIISVDQDYYGNLSDLELENVVRKYDGTIEIK